MAAGPLTRRIAVLRRRANRLRQLARRRHFRAAALARRALAAKQNAHHVRARNLMRRALRVKAMATRAGHRARLHHVRVAALRLARRARRV
jgi:hypothetical protein